MLLKNPIVNRKSPNRKSSVIIKLQGGLGNQLFQYAFAAAVAHRLDTNFQLDISYFEADLSQYPNAIRRKYELDIFDIDFPIVHSKHFFYTSTNRILTWLRKKMSHSVGLPNYIAEVGFLEQFKDNTYYEGYWQNEFYFQEISEKIKQSLKFRIPISEKALPTLKQIKDSESVCVHVRRTDFLTDNRYEVLGMDYYQKAIQELKNLHQNLLFFVFSDDIIWCKHQDFGDSKVIFVSDNQSLRDEFELMMTCKHHIIANSTLSWWAAWLNPNPDKKIIAPQKWFLVKTQPTTLIPERWIRA